MKIESKKTEGAEFHAAEVSSDKRASEDRTLGAPSVENAASDALKRVLLQHGGESVFLMPEPEGMFEKLLARGELWPGNRAKKIAGRKHRCHRNAALAYLRFCNDQTKWKSCEIVTGYALANTSFWCQHSWLLIDGGLSDTTMKFESYFGVVLDKVEACYFVLERVFELLPGIEQFRQMLRCEPDRDRRLEVAEAN